MQRKIFFLSLLLFSYLVKAEEILIWVPKAEVETLGIGVFDYKGLEKAGISPHPCGYVKSIEVTVLPPPDNPNFIGGTEKVYEFNREGAVINQWAMPVDSYLLAVSGTNIIVRKGSGAIEISRKGNISQSNQTAVQPAEPYECPQPIKSMYGNSSYVGCTKYRDISNNKSCYFVYEGVCS